MLDIISTVSPASALSRIDLDNIEPFTLILFGNAELTEFKWDGARRYEVKPDISKSYIWSSATLYDDSVIRHREKLFKEFLSNATQIDEAAVIDFHSGNNNDLENEFVINRDNQLKTLSITQAVIYHDRFDLNHWDLLSNHKHAISKPIHTEFNSLS